MQPSEPSWTDYQPGRRLACIDDAFVAELREAFDELKGVAMPSRGQIVTVDGAKPSPRGELLISLVEFPLPDVLVDQGYFWRKMATLGYPALSFKPLDESRLDQFRVHLQAAPADVPREAVPA